MPKKNFKLTKKNYNCSLSSRNLWCWENSTMEDLVVLLFNIDENLRKRTRYSKRGFNKDPSFGFKLRFSLESGRIQESAIFFNCMEENPPLR